MCRNYVKEFYNFDGDFPYILAEITDWMNLENPKDAVLLILEQKDTIHIQVLYN